MPIDELPPQIISKLNNCHAEEFSAVAMRLWQALAAELIPVIGSDGFSMLYTRSIYLARSSFPWLECDMTPQLASVHADSLKTCLAGQALPEANAAYQELLLTLTNILASLIGEPLTTRILRAAWGDDASDVESNARSVDHE